MMIVVSIEWSETNDLSLNESETMDWIEIFILQMFKVLQSKVCPFLLVLGFSRSQMEGLEEDRGESIVDERGELRGNWRRGKRENVVPWSNKK